MPDRPQKVYVIQGRGQRDYSDCQAALAHVPARMTALPFLGTEDEVDRQDTPTRWSPRRRRSPVP
jgi:hypothetical protein